MRELKEIEAAIHNLNVRVSELESWRDGDRCEEPVNDTGKWYLDNLHRLSIAELLIGAGDAMRRYDWYLFFKTVDEIEWRLEQAAREEKDA